MRQDTRGDVVWAVAWVLIACWFAFFISCLLIPETVESFIFTVEGVEGAPRYDYFMDFFNCVHDAAVRDLHGAYNSIYPPLTNLVYHGIFLITGDPDVDAKYGTALRDTNLGMYVFVVVLVIGILILFASAFMMGRNKDMSYQWIVIFVTLINVPIIYGALRGNSIMFSLAFLVQFFYMKDSKSPVVRHIGYLSFALAVCTKIYPVLFGLVLLRDKNKLPILWCALYTAILFFVPFLAFNGFETFQELLENLTSTQSTMDENGFGFFVGVTNTINVFLYLYVGPTAALSGSLSAIIKIVLVVVAILGSLSLRENWKVVTLIGCVVAMLPGFSSVYNLLFVIPGLIFFLDERTVRKSRSGQNSPVPAALWVVATVLYIAFFVAIFAPVPFGVRDALPELPGRWRMTTSCLLESCTLIVFFVVLGSQALYQCVARPVQMLVAGRSDAQGNALGQSSYVRRPVDGFMDGDGEAYPAQLQFERDDYYGDPYAPQTYPDDPYESQAQPVDPFAPQTKPVSTASGTRTSFDDDWKFRG